MEQSMSVNTVVLLQSWYNVFSCNDLLQFKDKWMEQIILREHILSC